MGSFLGVVIERYGDGRPLLLARSQCDSCHHALGVLDMVPLLSWVGLKGRCRYCSAPLSPFLPLIELAAFVPVLWAATILSGGLLAASAVFGWILIALSVIDWRHQRLPDALNLVLLLSGLGAAWFFDSGAWLEHVAAAAGAFLLLAGISAAYRLLRGRDGLGLGDAKLLAGLGAWLSWQGIPTVIFLAAMLGLAFFLARALFGHSIKLSDRIAFGPFLCAGGWIVWLYGPLVVQ